MALLSALVLTGPAGCGDPAPSAPATGEEAPPTAPPRRALAGIAGFQSRSELSFEALPDAPHLLEATYAFPDRSCWRLAPRGGATGRRLLVFRYGELALQLLPGEWESVELEGRERELCFLQMELRRAAMMWPDGWARAEGQRGWQAVLDGLGVLEALEPDDDGRPRVFRSRFSDGEACERLSGLRWQELAGRTWPAGWVLETPTGPVWSETILSIDAARSDGERYFLPPDRLRLDGREPWDPSAVRPLPLFPRATRRRSLAAGASWDEARREGERLVAEALQGLTEGGLPRPRALIEVGPDGRPAGILLAVPADRPPVPEGWTPDPHAQALALPLDDLRRVDATLIESMRRALPAGARAGAPYLRPAASGTDGPRAWLVLPYR